ncbi:MAG: hypothetical protein AAGD11_13395 [Planctomycetota bacterium]
MTVAKNTTRLMTTIVATGSVLFVGVLATPFASRWSTDQVASRLAQKLEAADDADAKMLLRQLEGLGSPAIESLVVAAASDRTAVAVIARQIVQEHAAQLATEASLKGDEQLSESTAAKAALLGRALARNVSDFGPAGKRWLEKLALQLVKITDQLPAKYSRQTLEDCELVLASVPPRGRKIRTVTLPRATDALPSAPTLPTPGPTVQPLTRASEQSLEILARIAPRGVDEPSKTSEPQLESMRALNSTDSFRPPAGDLRWSAQSLPLAAAKPLPPGKPQAGSASVPARQEPKTSAVTDIPTPREMELLATRLRRLSDETLFWKLEEAPRFRAGTILSVLNERGFEPAEIELRLQIMRVGSGERLRLVDDVAQLPALSASRTLRWLLEDESGDVRLRALTALATTQSATLDKIARDLATNDEDPRVAKLASQLLR